MMQQVATQNADVAAFAANTGQKEQNSAGTAAGFEQMLQQQTTPREPSPSARNKPAGTDATTNDRDKTSNKSTVTEVSESERKDRASGDDDVATAQEAITRDRQSAGEDRSAISDKSEAHDRPNGKGEKQLGDEPALDIDEDSVVSEDTTGQLADIEPQLADTWVSLVGKLQSLANMEQGGNLDILLQTSEQKADTQSDGNPLQARIQQVETIEQSIDQVAQLLAAEASLESLTDKEPNLDSSPTDSSILLAQLAQIIQDNGLAPSSSQTSDVIKKLEQLLANTEELSLGNKVDQELLALSLGVDESEDAQDVVTQIEALLAITEELPLENEVYQELLNALPKPVDSVEAQTSNQLQTLKEPQIGVSAELSEAKPENSETELPLMTDKVGGADPVKLLLSMSEGKLEKTLNNLAQRIVSSASESNTQGANQEFIAALQAGVAELKSQLAQGREPGLDLQALVAEAMSKANMAAKQPELLDIKVKSFTQVLDFAQQLSTALDLSQASNANALSTESGQIQVEQLKQSQIQSSQLGAQLDKAINIAKPEGHQQLAEKVRWMVNAKQLVADIRLDPAELGSMQVKVSMNGESATVNFVVQSHHARDALENATAKLRELLGERGIELGQSSVKQDQGEQASNEEKHLNKGRFGADGEELAVTDEQESENFIQQPIINGALGGIDYFV